MYIQEKIVFAPYDRVIRYLLPIIPKGVKPNHLTFIRLIFSPILIVLLVGKEDILALILFLVLAVTDMLDGSLARLRNQVTDWGKVWDPVADKLLIGIVISVLLLQINLSLTIFLLVFELAFILGGTFQRMKSGDIEIQANIWGKIKMNLQCLGVCLLILGAIMDLSILIYAAQIALYVSLFFAALSLFKRGI